MTSFHFPISGVETPLWLPAIVAFLVSMFMAPGGLSGAFLLLPFQVSVLGFSGPAVSPTNLIFNIIAIPSGVIRYWREKRMVWPLAWGLLIGSLPGIFIGAIVRINYLPDPRSFKFFVGCVLVYIGSRLAWDVINRQKKPAGPPPTDFEVQNAVMTLKEVRYSYQNETYRIPTWILFGMSFLVGIIGGVYGIGGGAILAPFLVAVYRFQVHSIAGASLFSTLFSSLAGVIIYTIIAPMYAHTGLSVTPDWLLGSMFGLGGAAGIYIGAMLQKRFPATIIKGIIAAALLYISVNYILQFFR